jgi:hypothetical protein
MTEPMRPHPDSGLAAQLLALELQLMDPAFRRDRTAVSALLADGFREFGSSGRYWSREATLDLLATESDYTLPAVEDFAVQSLSPAIALVTYRTVRPHLQSLRSSLWVLEHAQWRILFHQGTKIPPV